MNNIQEQFASAFANMPTHRAPPVQVVVPPQLEGGGSTWKWIAIFLVGVILVGVVLIFATKSAPEPKKRVIEVLQEEGIQQKKKRKMIPPISLDEEEKIEEEDPSSHLSPELMNDTKFTSMADIMRQKQQGILE